MPILKVIGSVERKGPGLLPTFNASLFPKFIFILLLQDLLPILVSSADDTVLRNDVIRYRLHAQYSILYMCTIVYYSAHIILLYQRRYVAMI